MMPFLIPILTAMAVLCFGGAVLVARGARRARIAERLAAGTFTDVAGDGSGGGSAAVVEALNRFGTLFSRTTSSSLKEDLARAGFHGPAAATAFIGTKMILLTTGVLITLSLGVYFQWPPAKIFLAGIIICGLLFFVPNLVVEYRRKARRLEIRCHLPDAIDLLEIAVSSGMGMDMAWNSVADEVRTVSPILADEMALTNLEIHLGATRTVAMRHMADRTGASELSSLVACMLQSEKFGTSLSDALRNFATSMRETRSQRAQEAAEKMAIKLIFPMILFVFPPVVMVMAGPALMALSRALAGQG